MLKYYFILSHILGKIIATETYICSKRMFVLQKHITLNTISHKMIIYMYKSSNLPTNYTMNLFLMKIVQMHENYCFF